MHTGDDIRDVSDDINDTIKETKNTVVCKKNIKYYYADPEWRKKHLAYCYERLVCDVCGGTYNRNNKSNHVKARKHTDKLYLKENADKIQQLEDKIRELENKICNDDY